MSDRPMDPFPGEQMLYRFAYHHGPRRLRSWLIKRSFRRLNRSVAGMSVAFANLGAAMRISLVSLSEAEAAATPALSTEETL